MIPEILKKYPKVYEWVQDCVALCQPDRVSIFLDPVEDDQKYTNILLEKGSLKPLKRPSSFYIATDPLDTARVEESTFICTSTKHLCGITNNWKDPHEMKIHLRKLFQGCMKGREMIIIPYCMGAYDSPSRILAIEITDSPYVAISMRRMARCGLQALELMASEEFVPGLHSVGFPLGEDQVDPSWPCDPKNRVIAHFPETKEIYSYGSGYGGNALLGKKCLSLRIASYLGYKHGFLAEHMLIMSIENPRGEKKYFAAAFPSACGKTNLAMIESHLPGWKAKVIGDDIAWIHIDENGHWRAINPEFGFFGVAPGTSWRSNLCAMKMIQSDTLFTNTGYTSEGDVFWEGLDPVPPHLLTWKGEVYDGKEKAAHPNSRFTVPLENCDQLDPMYSDPKGVVLDAIIFGGRRAQACALVSESTSYEHGVFMGATLSSETTAASVGEVGVVRQDPFAMLPFCGYDMALYFQHWLNMGKKSHPPKIFSVNWFRKNERGGFVWPGFSENMRVLKWIFERCDGKHHGIQEPYGIIPLKSELDLKGLEVNYETLFDVPLAVQEKEKSRHKTFLERFGEDLPKELRKFL